LNFIGTNAIPGDYFTWNATSTTLTFYPKVRVPRRNYLYNYPYSGTYKLAVYAGTLRLGVSNVFQVKKMLVEITMSNRNIYQAERVSFNVYNPYVDFVDLHNPPRW
jgi:hypothetical protein